MGRFDELKRLRDSTVTAAKGVDGVSKAIKTTRSVTEAAASEAKLTNRSGELSKWRIAKAAARPTTTGRRLLKGAVHGLEQSADNPSAERRGAEPSDD